MSFSPGLYRPDHPTRPPIRHSKYPAMQPLTSVITNQEMYKNYNLENPAAASALAQAPASSPNLE